ncbi:hypothetical protein AAZX31_08G235700 [Glycine max]|nr:hypothetical protein JHK85_022757 [Glycine max]KAG5026379.1 hypothetical protein JHK86_022293 [Glycine max]KAG5137536.1 hypothetical protein JHK82_022267 [Glycine max]KHM98818.1 hypothetical protein glysoja_022228 [Glycine soja]
MSVVTAQPQTSPTAEVRLISTELQVQECYKLYVEPTRGCRKLTMEDEYMVSPKFPFNFKLPFFLSICEVTCDSYIEEELERLPISSGLARYLKPFILESVLV